jgi:acyl-CoA synthetase (AMP-forming)/AMP-acid ligase II
VTHAALLANLRMLATGLEVERETRMVSWLPVYHDMGLVLGLLTPAYAGAISVLLPPLSFLQQPLRWPRAITQYRGTLSGAPSFAFDLCARAAERDAPSGIDLSTWKAAICGAEPVRSGSLDRFARAFEAHGFRRAALLPAYGLAEATLLASIGTPGEGVVTTPHPATGREITTCGAPAVGERLVIADPDSLAPLPEAQIGEILLAGPNVAAGYWMRAAESEAVFGCRVPGEGEQRFLRTGDLGFLSGGRVAIVGRAKDLIIIRGENHHPEDIEASAGGAHPLLAAGTGAAFSIETDAGEELVIVFEMPRSSEPHAAEIGRAVTACVTEAHGLALRELALIRSLTLPRTANGKVQRSRCRELYLADALPWVARLPGARRVA